MLSAPKSQVAPACAVGAPALGSVHQAGQLTALQPRQQRSGLRQLRRRPGVGGSSRRRTQASAEAVYQGSGTMALPLDYYKLLGVSGVCSRDSLAKALEKALTNPPSVGYSQQLLLARGSALKRACDTLLDPQSRRDFDDALRAGEITEDVPEEFVPGVLALLLEAGEAQTVVAAGEEWLSTHRRDPRARDVALSTALAHRAVAASYVKRFSDAATAAGMLEVAVDLLRRHRAGSPALQEEVAEDLAELQPLLACQLVALPLERFQERERGVQVAISVLTSPKGGRKAISKQQFLDRLADTLTAAEQIEVYEAAGKAYAELPAELYNVAVAYVADATAAGRPAQLDKALAALEQAAAAVPPGAIGQSSESGVRQLAERRALDERNRRQVAYAVCQLLLGETAAAGDTMGLFGGEVKCERSLLAFIKANSPDNTDLLPGLCVLAQRWVHDVALASFRGSQGTAFTLEGWFGAPPVKRYLARRAQGSGPAPLNPVAAAIKRATEVLTAPAIEAMAGVLALMGLLTTQQQLEAEAEAADLAAEQQAAAAAEAEAQAVAAIAAEPAAAGPAAGEEARPLAAAAAAPAPAAADAPVVPAGRSPTEVTQAADGADMSQVDMRRTRQARQLRPRHTARPELTAAAAAATAKPPTDGVPMPSPEVFAELAAEGDAFDANALFSKQPVDQLTPLDGEDNMWDSKEQRSVRWGRLVATVGLLAGGGFLLGRSMLAQPPSGGLAAAPASAAPRPAAAATAAAAAASAAAPVVPSLSRSEAVSIISKWQGIKAQALGPKHDVKGLSAVLSGDVLAQWRARAEEVQRKGWHYLHTLEGSQINSVSVDPASGVASVSATFREAVEAHRGDSEPVQSFRSEYSVDYELVREGSSWLITAAQVRY